MTLWFPPFFGKPNQKEIGRFIKQRHKIRQETIDEKEAGQTSVPAPLLQLP